jgi:hypothetical protein
MKDSKGVSMRNLLISLMLFIATTFVSADECIDDPTGAFYDMGFTCDFLVNSWGMSCDGSFLGNNISDVCPVTCESSPADDPMGVYADFGGCEMVINVFGMSCDGMFGGYTVSNICMESCEACGSSGTSGCDLPHASHDSMHIFDTV